MKEPKLYPQWFTYYEIGGKVGVEALEYYLNKVEALTYLFGTADLDDAVAVAYYKNLAMGLHNQTIEAKALLDRWWEENSARRDHTVEVEAIK